MGGVHGSLGRMVAIHAIWCEFINPPTHTMLQLEIWVVGTFNDKSLS
jgi:hypothetical protein